MSVTPAVGSLLGVQRDGVRAICEITGRFDDSDWLSLTPCEGWTAVDLAGHVLTVIENWHVLLDDSEAGARSARFGWAQMDRHFVELLAALPDSSGPERIAQFAESAAAYFDRVAGLDPELPLVSALTDIAAVPVTVGLFTWIGGTEWHVHAWDFARTVGEEYRSEQASVFYEGGMVMRGLSARDEDPWDALLDRVRPNRGGAVRRSGSEA